jgi:hypothetical protein
VFARDLGLGSIKTFRIFLDAVADSHKGNDAAFHGRSMASGVTLVHCPEDGRKKVTSKNMFSELQSTLLV